MTAARGPTWTEQHRLACEARHVLALPSKEQRNQYLADIEEFKAKEKVASAARAKAAAAAAAAAAEQKA